MTQKIVSVIFDDFWKDPENELAAFAIADREEEDGHDAIAFAYRWMGHHHKRPGHRVGDRLKKNWVWYVSGAQGLRRGPDAVNCDHTRYLKTPHAHLDRLLFAAMGLNIGEMKLYETPGDAIRHLSHGLIRLQAILEPPPGVVRVRHEYSTHGHVRAYQTNLQGSEGVK